MVKTSCGCWARHRAVPMIAWESFMGIQRLKRTGAASWFSELQRLWRRPRSITLPFGLSGTRRIAMRLVVAALLFGLAMAPFCIAHLRAAPNEDEFAVLLERLRKESPGECDKVVELAK